MGDTSPLSPQRGRHVDYADLKDNVAPMLVVHIGMVVFVPLFALVIYLLLRGIESTAARIARIALVPFVLYVAWEAMQGIANGVLTDKVNSLPSAEQAVGADLIQEFAESPLVRDAGALIVPASIALVVATVALGIALRNAGAPRWAPVLFGFAGALISAHLPPFGPTGPLCRGNCPHHARHASGEGARPTPWSGIAAVPPLRTRRGGPPLHERLFD